MANNALVSIWMILCMCGYVLLLLHGTIECVDTKKHTYGNLALIIG